MKSEMLEDVLPAINKLQNISSYTELESRAEFDFSASNLNIIDCDLQCLLDANVAVLTIESEREDEWASIDKAGYAKCILTLDKTEFIKFFLVSVEDASSLLFFSVAVFEKWFSSLPSPFSAEHPFNRAERTAIWLGGFENTYCGSCLTILPIKANIEPEFDRDAIDLPDDESIRSQVHVLSDYTVKIEPVRFRLPVIAADQECLKPIFDCYQELLISCLVKEFYTREKVVVSGIKRITTALSSDEFEVDLEHQKILEDCVRWVYDERTETRLLLLMDRLSLDLPEGSSLLPYLYPHLAQALEQAQWRYEFVIKDRKEAHAKELAELQKDVKAASDGYSKSAHELVEGLLKDVLSSIFLLSIGLLSRLAGREGFLASDLFAWLAQGLSLYLVLSVIIRIFIGFKGLQLSLNDLIYWKNVTRNHMSENEFKEHVTVRTSPYKQLYNFSAFGVFIIHIALAIFVWNMPSLFLTSSEIEHSISIEDRDERVDQVDSSVTAKSALLVIDQTVSAAMPQVASGHEYLKLIIKEASTNSKPESGRVETKSNESNP